jgi:hypothetical protein
MKRERERRQESTHRKTIKSRDRMGKEEEVEK